MCGLYHNFSMTDAYSRTGTKLPVLYCISDISKIKTYFLPIFTAMLLNQMNLHLCFLYYKQQLLHSNPNVRESCVP